MEICLEGWCEVVGWYSDFSDTEEEIVEQCKKKLQRDIIVYGIHWQITLNFWNDSNSSK